ncbi:hypothetical protein ACHWQZ_G019017 [Mnemiopsis leidyi]
MSYFIYQRHQIFLSCAILNVLGIILFFFLPLPVSPRFSELIERKKEEAIKTLLVLAQLSGSMASLDTIDLVYEERNQLKETLLGMVVWFMISLISYSYQFEWSKIVVIVMNILAMLDVRFTSTWSLEHLVSIIGNIATSSAFAMIQKGSTSFVCWTFLAGMAHAWQCGSFLILLGEVSLRLLDKYSEKKEGGKDEGKTDEDEARIVFVNGLNGHLVYDDKSV